MLIEMLALENEIGPNYRIHRSRRTGCSSSTPRRRAGPVMPAFDRSGKKSGWNGATAPGEWWQGTVRARHDGFDVAGGKGTAVMEGSERAGQLRAR